MATGIENTYWLCIAWDNLHKINYIYLCFVSGDISWKKLLWNIYVHCLCGFTIMSTYTYCKCKLTVKIIQFSSVTKSCWLFVTPWDCSTPSFPVHHELLEFTQTHVYWVGDAIQPSHLSSSSPPSFNLSQHQGLFHWVSSLHHVAKRLEFQLQHESFQWIFRSDLL